MKVRTSIEVGKDVREKERNTSEDCMLVARMGTTRSPLSFGAKSHACLHHGHGDVSWTVLESRKRHTNGS